MTHDAVGAAHALLEGMAQAALPEWEQLAGRVGVRQVAPGETLLREGAAWPQVAVVFRGLVKLVYLRDDGTERIKSFIDAGGFFASLSALAPGGVSSFSVVAVEPSEIACLPYPVILELADRHLPWQKALRRALEFYGQRKEQRERELLTLGPPDRYRLLLQQSPELLRRVPQKDLALYLGITPVSLSRIRARLGREGSGGRTLPTIL